MVSTAALCFWNELKYWPTCQRNVSPAVQCVGCVPPRRGGLLPTNKCSSLCLEHSTFITHRMHYLALQSNLIWMSWNSVISTASGTKNTYSCLVLKSDGWHRIKEEGAMHFNSLSLESIFCLLKDKSEKVFTYSLSQMCRPVGTVLQSTVVSM